jgi:hypothetical protein
MRCDYSLLGSSTLVVHTYSRERGIVDHYHPYVQSTLVISYKRGLLHRWLQVEVEKS